MTRENDMLVWRIWARLVQQFDDRATAQEWRLTALRRWLTFSAFVLLIATWTLWTPQNVYPRVPLLTGWSGLPATGETIAIATAVVALLATLATWKRAYTWRLGLLVFAVAMVLLFCGDQHRLQPWAYQFVVLAIVLAAVAPWRAIVLARMLAVSIYFYSALSKFDETFLTTIGPRFRDSLLGWSGLSVDHWGVAVMFPLGELAVAMLLVFRRTRTVGWIGSLAMHGLMLLILGPLGLGHRWGVLLWNVYFVGQNLILFAPLDRLRRSSRADDGNPIQPRRIQTITRSRVLSALAETLLAMVLIWPALQIFGWCDNWIAWGLYAPRAERVAVFVDVDDVDRLPPACRDFLVATDAGEPWRQLRIDRWSLATLGVPIYPQNRFQLGVALAVVSATNPRGQFHVVAHGRANRITGRRRFREYWGAAELRGAAREYWLGMVPRPMGPIDRE